MLIAANIISGSRTRTQVRQIASPAPVPRSYHEVTLSTEKDLWIEAFLQEVKSLETTAGMKVVGRPEITFIIPT